MYVCMYISSYVRTDLNGKFNLFQKLKLEKLFRLFYIKFLNILRQKVIIYVGCRIYFFVSDLSEYKRILVHLYLRI